MMWRLFLASVLLWCAAPGHGTEPANEAAGERVILVLGDSLSAAYGLPLEAGWVSLLSQRLERQRREFRVINASISGETTRGALERLPELLQRHAPAILILELGANDGLRGYPMAEMRQHLAAMVDMAHAAGAQVLLLGIRIPPNYGPAYVGQFESVFSELGAREDVHYVPFLLEGFAGDFGMFQPDGIHPTADAQPLMLDTVWSELEPLLQPGPVTSSESG